MSASTENPKIVSLPEAQYRHLAQVTRASVGEALEVRLDGRSLPVSAHLDTVTPLSIGDAVLVEATVDGVVVVGRLRRPGEPPAVPVRVDGEGRLLFDARAGVILRAAGSTLELRPDGAIVLEGRTILARAEGLHRLQGATIELN